MDAMKTTTEPRTIKRNLTKNELPKPPDTRTPNTFNNNMERAVQLNHNGDEKT